MHESRHRHHESQHDILSLQLCPIALKCQDGRSMGGAWARSLTTVNTSTQNGEPARALAWRREAIMAKAFSMPWCHLHVLVDATRHELSLPEVKQAATPVHMHARVSQSIGQEASLLSIFIATPRSAATGSPLLLKKKIGIWQA